MPVTPLPCYHSTVTNKLYQSEINAITEETVESLISVLPELGFIRDRVMAHLAPLALAMGPMLDYTRRVPSEPAEEGETMGRWTGRRISPSETKRWATCSGVGFDHGELAGLCDCSAGMSGSSDHLPTCPAYRTPRPTFEEDYASDG